MQNFHGKTRTSSCTLELKNFADCCGFRLVIDDSKVVISSYYRNFLNSPDTGRKWKGLDSIIWQRFNKLLNSLIDILGPFKVEDVAGILKSDEF